MADSRLCRNSEKGYWEALNGDAIDLIAQHMDITGAVRLAACSRELCNLIGNNEGNVHHWDEPCLLMPLPAYWFDEHWDEATDIHLHDTVYNVVPLDNPRHSILLPFMHDRMWVGMNGDWIAAVGDSGDWCLGNVCTDRHIPLTLPPRLVPTRAPQALSYRIGCRWHISNYNYISWFDGRTDETLTLRKIVICEVPTKHGHYADYKPIALFDQALAYRGGGSQEWRLLKKSDISLEARSRRYCDAIELGGFIYAVDGVSSNTYCWDATHDANLELPFVIRPPAVEHRPYAWFLAPSGDGKRLMIILPYFSKAHLGKEPTGIPYIVTGLILREYPSYASYVFEQDPCSARPAGVLVWRQVYNLDDHSLFLGLNYPIIANLKEGDAKAPNGKVVPFMRKNCVYTAYQWFYGNEFPKIFRCNLQADEGEFVGVISLPRDGWLSACVRLAMMWFKTSLHVAKSALAL